jgi:hypothetical protein
MLEQASLMSGIYIDKYIEPMSQRKPLQRMQNDIKFMTLLFRQFYVKEVFVVLIL